MKRTPLRRKTSLKAKTGFKKPQKYTNFAQNRPKLRRKGKTETSRLKEEIQAILRQIVIKRDRACQRCGIEYGTEGVVFQCDHLMSRSHSATYADSRLCVLLCKPCHAWKSLGNNLRKKQFDEMIYPKLPKDRQNLWDRCEQEQHIPKRTTANDWQLHIVGLKHELKSYE